MGEKYPYYIDFTISWLFNKNLFYKSYIFLPLQSSLCTTKRNYTSSRNV